MSINASLEVRLGMRTFLAPATAEETRETTGEVRIPAKAAHEANLERKVLLPMGTPFRKAVLFLSMIPSFLVNGRSSGRLVP
ncbi:MAG: hypothetical protein JRH06_13590 [Deltaproteobacteria bacterium]|nr:hypothetical protein [Deltaproteobacteria bacterium]MBW2138575.1 hypothetical protein [Deltaproteobacteria bacterium]